MLRLLCTFMYFSRYLYPQLINTNEFQYNVNVPYISFPLPPFHPFLFNHIHMMTHHIKWRSTVITALSPVTGKRTSRREPASFNNKGTGIGQDGLEYIIASCYYRDISIFILITYMLFVCI